MAIEKLSQASIHEEFKKIADQINLLEEEGEEVIEEEY